METYWNPKSSDASLWASLANPANKEYIRAMKYECMAIIARQNLQRNAEQIGNGDLPIEAFAPHDDGTGHDTRSSV